jgi:NADH:ubiquinone oxidoreductase subunit K
MNFSLLLFLIGILGFVLNRKNIILMIIAIEIMLLAVTLLILISSFGFNDNGGQTFSIYIISIAGAESVIGLSILVAYYRFKTSKSLVYFIKRLCNNVAPKLQIKQSHSSFSTNSRKYSTYLSTNLYSYPLFITGLFDAEGSFVITILKNPGLKQGWRIQARIQIKMHEKDRALIQSIQDFFGNIGYVSKPNNTSMVEFRVSTIQEIVEVIIPHFDSYPLITKKYLDFLLFKQIVLKLKNKEHNTYEGIQEIVNIRASLNLGLPNNLKISFPKALPVKKPSYEFTGFIEPSWLAGFATGESNFFIAVQNSNSGLIISLRFSISQHSRDLLILESLVHFFNCGYVTKYEKRSVCEFIVTKIDHIVEHVIPFLDKHPVVGSKQFNYLKFKNAAYIIKNKEHLNPDRKGLEKLLELKRAMSKNSEEKGEK